MVFLCAPAVKKKSKFTCTIFRRLEIIPTCYFENFTYRDQRLGTSSIDEACAMNTIKTMYKKNVYSFKSIVITLRSESAHIETSAVDTYSGILTIKLLFIY